MLLLNVTYMCRYVYLYFHLYMFKIISKIHFKTYIHATLLYKENRSSVFRLFLREIVIN